MKTIALYLPQFHRIKENDEWWGEGYTEWTAVKKAEPQYVGHYLPRVPLNENYYDLMEKETLEWQGTLAKKYKIDGFSFYHYYFKDGKMVLEKPAENLLRWKNIGINFFFSWDAATWARSWSGLGNSWADTFENDHTNSDVILLEQKVGNEYDWEKHLDYLLPFFHDDRYIKIDEKPVFNILSLNSIPCIHRMIAYWRRRVVEKGFKGLYIITTNEFCESADAYINPMRPEKNEVIHRLGNGIKVYDYDRVWINYLNCRGKIGIDNIWQCMVDYDDTPRKGRRAMIFEGGTPQKFKEYYAALRYKSQNTRNPFVFVNAWNEWAEGMYLEPDTANRYKYLEAIRDVNQLDDGELKAYVAKLNFISDVDVDKNHHTDSEYVNQERIRRNYMLMKSWLEAKINNNAIKYYLLKHGYKEVAIYGFGHQGRMIYDELKQDGIKVPFVIDQRAEQLKVDIVPCIGINHELPECDLVVISITIDMPYIYGMLKNKVNCDILSMHELCVYANEEMNETNKK